MKITNVTVAWVIIILFCIYPFLHESIWGVSTVESWSYFAMLTWKLTSLSTIFCIVIIATLLLLQGDIKFEFTIPTPWSVIKDYYVKKREKEEKKTELFIKMYKTDNTEALDKLIKELEKL